MATPTATPRPARTAYLALWGLWGVGLALNSLLALQVARLGPGGLPGCAVGRADCHSVLTSEYSQVFGRSLTTYGFGYYAALAAAMLVARRRAADALPVVGTIGVITAGWAVGIMARELRQYCPWCLAVHATNTVWFLTALSFAAEARKRRRDELLAVGLRLRPWSGLLAGALAVLMAAGQLYVLEAFHDVRPLTVDTTGPAAGAFPILALDREDEPIRTTKGNSDVPPRLVVFTCFTCGRCADMDRQLRSWVAKHPDRLRIDVRFAPLCPYNCGHPPDGAAPHPACDLARAALAVAAADPSAYTAFADWLYENRGLVDGAAAAAEGRRRVGSAAFDTAWMSDRVKDRLTDDFLLAEQVGATSVPQVYLPAGQVTGSLSPANLDWLMSAVVGEPARTK